MKTFDEKRIMTGYVNDGYPTIWANPTVFQLEHILRKVCSTYSHRDRINDHYRDILGAFFTTLLIDGSSFTNDQFNEIVRACHKVNRIEVIFDIDSIESRCITGDRLILAHSHRFVKRKYGEDFLQEIIKWTEDQNFRVIDTNNLGIVSDARKTARNSIYDEILNGAANVIEDRLERLISELDEIKKGFKDQKYEIFKLRERIELLENGNPTAYNENPVSRVSKLGKPNGFID